MFTDGWVCYKSSLYFISFEMKNWNDSRTYCQKKGSDLIIINYSEEQVSEIRVEEECNLSKVLDCKTLCMPVMNYQKKKKKVFSDVGVALKSGGR